MEKNEKKIDRINKEVNYIPNHSQKFLLKKRSIIYPRPRTQIQHRSLSIITRKLCVLSKNRRHQVPSKASMLLFISFQTRNQHCLSRLPCHNFLNPKLSVSDSDSDSDSDSEQISYLLHQFQFFFHENKLNFYQVLATIFSI